MGGILPPYPVLVGARVTSTRCPILRPSDFSLSQGARDCPFSFPVLPHSEPERTAGWVIMNPIGVKFHEPDTQALHASRKNRDRSEAPQRQGTRLGPCR
jgi:hypothetical protein